MKILIYLFINRYIDLFIYIYIYRNNINYIIKNEFTDKKLFNKNYKLIM